MSVWDKTKSFFSSAFDSIKSGVGWVKDNIAAPVYNKGTPVISVHHKKYHISW